MTLRINTSRSSPNFNNRPVGTKPIALLIHTTEGRWPTDLQWLCSQSSQVSCHYVISPTGTVFQIVNDAKRAWHAGVGTYQGYADWNNISLGVEVSHKQGDTYSVAQKDALWDLCTALIAKYDIRQNLIAAHRWVTPGRRSDPTDWPDADFKAWIGRLYAPVAPPTPDQPYGTVPIDPRLQDYWERSGGLWQSDQYCLGYAILPLTNGVQLFERGGLRINPDGRIDALLLREAVELLP